MKVFLTQDIKGLGKKGDTKEVNDGYAKNFLFPKKMAILPQDQLSKEITRDKISHREQENRQHAALIDRVRQLDGQEFVFTRKADNHGRLYGAIGPKEIAKELSIDEKMVKNHYKELGIFPLEINFGPDAIAHVQIVIKKEL